MAAATTLQSLPADVLAIDSAKAPRVVRLRPDEAPVPASALFARLAPAPSAGGAIIPGRPSAVGLTVTLSPAPLCTVTAVFTITHAGGAALPLPRTCPLRA